MLVLISAFLVGLLGALRQERTASHLHYESYRAEVAARDGLEHAVALLRTNTADPNRFWISMPGSLVVSPPASDPGKTTYLPPLEKIALYSGEAVPGVASADLNLPAWSDPGRALFSPYTNPMELKWIHLRQDGSRDTTPTPALDPGNPIIARYAFWTDDESSRINLNTAWTRGPENPNALSHLSRVTLTALTGTTETIDQARAMANDIATFRSTRHCFNSAREALQVSSAMEVLRSNEACSTHCSHDPDTTFFNEPRIVLTTQASLAGGRLFLDILKTPDSDPGQGATLAETLDSAKLGKTLGLLRRYLERTDWPVASGSSFQKKYYSNNPDRLLQLALNIIDYVRCKESSALLVRPIRGQMVGGSFVFGLANKAGVYIGVTRAPMITEVGAWVAPTAQWVGVPTAPETTGYWAYDVKLVTELYLPDHYGIEKLDAAPFRLTEHKLTTQLAGSVKTPNGTLYENWIQLADILSPSDKVLRAGSYAVICQNRKYKAGTNPAAPDPRPSTCYVRIAFSQYGGTDTKFDITPILDATPVESYYISCPVDPIGTALSSIRSAEVDDPRVNSHVTDWKPSSSGNSFGKHNQNRTVGKKAAPAQPQADTDAAGLITDASLFMPPPKGHPDNPFGIVESVGELGYICTGIEATDGAGMPWRTLRLQPNNGPESVVPDWALMDIFTALNSVTSISAREKSIYQPHGTSVGGRININAAIQPFPDLIRLIPLESVFRESSHLTLSASEIAQNICSHELAATVNGNGKRYGNADYFDSPGEIVEIRGVADQGESSEALVREIANLITTRGNVFRVYTIGQSIRQTRTGQLQVTAESRSEHLVERYTDPVTRLVQFRTIYSRRDGL